MNSELDLLVPRQPEGYADSASGLLVPERNSAAQRPMPKALDLFCGAGGASCGFHQAGWHVVAAVESWDIAALTYLVNLGSPATTIHFATDDDKRRWDLCLKKNKSDPSQFGSGWISSHCDHSSESCAQEHDGDAWFHETYCADPPHRMPCEHFWFGDIRHIKTAEVLEALEMEPGDLDNIVGGPPCQGFSVAGKRQVMDPRNSLVFEFCRFVVGLQPKTMVMENVMGIRTMVTPEGINVVDAICLYLQEGGYGTFDALKHSLAGMPNAKAAVRGSDKSAASVAKEPRKARKKQMEMAI